jgi:hypothetical protein
MAHPWSQIRQPRVTTTTLVALMPSGVGRRKDRLSAPVLGLTDMTSNRGRVSEVCAAVLGGAQGQHHAKRFDVHAIKDFRRSSFVTLTCVKTSVGCPRWRAGLAEIRTLQTREGLVTRCSMFAPGSVRLCGRFNTFATVPTFVHIWKKTRFCGA